MNEKETIFQLLGKQSKSDTELQKRMRLHQSWWRAFVLAEEPGQHPKKPDETIGSSIKNGESTLLNFMDEHAVRAARETLDNRNKKSKGMINEERLFNNLLSSQPLCFNFFGRLKYNLLLATKVFQKFFPLITEVTGIFFEFVPEKAQNNDNSADDIAIEFRSGQNKKGIIGLECKYTETFSQKKYSSDNYKHIYSLSEAFISSYDELTHPKYNQLFRNQLIIESALLNHTYDIGFSGLFCYQGDRNALTTGNSFQKMLKNGEERFKIVTFAGIIETIQKLNIDWETREWSMMLWNRYCETKLSEKFTP